MLDKIWWHFEDFMEWLIQRVSKKAYRPKPGDEDRGVAVTRDGRIYYGKYYREHPNEAPSEAEIRKLKK